MRCVPAIDRLKMKPVMVSWGELVVEIVHNGGEAIEIGMIVQVINAQGMAELVREYRANVVEFRHVVRAGNKRVVQSRTERPPDVKSVLFTTMLYVHVHVAHMAQVMIINIGIVDVVDARNGVPA